ncbi:MAG: carbonic anhydrase family protein [Rickettsiales bacterium]|jgi:carbonic anhydrase|nr:carbonic anhydrase family protein [Rickettsiales bacterium]
MKKLIIISLIILIPVIGISTLYFKIKHESENTKKHNSWSYEGNTGPEFWHSLSDEYTLCSDGTSQSPINIITADTISAKANTLQQKYQNTPLAIINNGETIKIKYNSDSYLKIGASIYKLVQFHFHTPSEHHINGVAHPMVIHLVHTNADGDIAVLAVFIEEGEANSTISTILNNVPDTKHKVVRLDNVEINASDLLPINGSHYQFSSSLTTPPCSENVLWNILKDPITLSKEQIDKFISIMGDNARPIQPLNDRKIILINTDKILE